MALEPNGNLPPFEFEEMYYCSEHAPTTITGVTEFALRRNRGIHIQRTGWPEGIGLSGFALRLVFELRVRGLVEHTLWEELR
ncbi:MAG: hypothetical protein OER90_16280 [Gemmatimonadota bacterium]|nr:hypothetical protein [Gemmatimonadota bacterium]